MENETDGDVAVTTVLVTGGSGFIGRHLLELLMLRGYRVVNLDVRPPRVASHVRDWTSCSILDKSAMASVVAKEKPDIVVHLAAVTAMDGASMDDYRVNTEGTANVIEAVRRSQSIQRLIVASTQHVREPGSGIPRDDTDYAPLMLYGRSKVAAEIATRTADLNCAWTIIRPTTVWGPGHTGLADGLWRLMKQGRYFHPRKDAVVRSYGYVKNVVWQIERMFLADRPVVDCRVFYVADGNCLQLDWVNAISRELTGHEVRSVPLWTLRTLSAVGDKMRALGFRFPLYDARLKNLVTPNPVPVEPTLALLGQPPYTLQQGARETVEWLETYYRTGLV